MYIPLFVCGILFTIVFEIAAVIVVVIIQNIKKKRKRRR